MAAACDPATGAGGADGRLVLCMAARRLLASVGATRAISVGLASAVASWTSKPGTVNMAPGEEPSVPPVERGSGPTENCASREPSGAGAGALGLGSRPTMATLTAAVDADAGSAGASGREGSGGPGLRLPAGATNALRGGGAGAFASGSGAFAARFADRVGASGSVGAGLSTGRPARGATKVRGLAFTGCTASRFPGPLTFRAVRISRRLGQRGCARRGLGHFRGRHKQLRLWRRRWGAVLNRQHIRRLQIRMQFQFGRRLPDELPCARRFRRVSQNLLRAIFTSARGGCDSVARLVGDTSGNFWRKSYQTSLLACGAMVFAYSDLGFPAQGPEATHTRMMPCVNSETVNGTGLDGTNHFSFKCLTACRRIRFRGHLADVHNMFLSRDILRQKLAQLPQTLGLGARAQQRVQKIQVLEALRQLEAELRIVQIGLGRELPEHARFEQALVLRQSHVLHFERRRPALSSSSKNCTSPRR